ncbi:protein REPRESSOR OF SILENCING 3 [Ricinus communis]|uniref:RRM domain-containing protein n=1 Tax=Ricinus communis TaxID=3988 RepID=B9SAB6_RICCO|nr:protein REPRESSOR OF SILENCING 3 [Ricinus communis]EEF39446.1 conserved hypothetical protein [Ricinus communis]|eukprot:XP_002522935.1 uncharacterized protein LOC8282884 [Ricinus communis]
MEAAAATTTMAERVRIHVGGLGENVTRDDLCNLLSKVGIGFQSVDIIRTKGRSFAYIDFLPSSVSALPKLFNTYNGCVWKGGRLKLDKAKEHYLDRLKREWAEDAQLANSTCSDDVNNDADKQMESPRKTKKDLSLDKKQLRLFFPRLQKLKSIPFSGTGKHKYSFRRVEVPSLPLHFCDCEEHSGSLHAPKGKQIPVLEEQGGGVNQEELDLMISVMNRLFEIENVSGAPHSDNELTKEEDYNTNATDNPQLDESEGYSTADEDDLIINVVSRRKETAFSNQESKLNKRQASEDRPAQEVLRKRTRNDKENDTNNYVSVASQGKGSLQAPSNGPGMLSGDQLIESQSIVKQSAPGVSWSQKSSWRELVGNRNNNAISISDILPGISANKEEETKSAATLNSNKGKNKELLKHENQRGQLDKAEVEGLAEAQDTKMDFASDKAGRGSAWLHKASWTQLVNSSNSNSFSITQILPGVTFDKHEPAKSDGDIIADSRGFKHGDTVETGKNELTIDGTRDFRVGRDGVAKETPESSRLIVIGNNNTSAPTKDRSYPVTEEKGSGVVAIDETHLYMRTEESNTNTSPPTEIKNNSATKEKGGVVTIGETRPFMRTEESVKEWANIRAALSGSRKRTSKGQ